MSNQDFYRERSERKRKNRQRELALRLAFLVISLVLILVIVGIVATVKKIKERGPVQREVAEQSVEQYMYNAIEPELDVQLLTVNEYSRPAIALEQVNGIVIHWTANPGTTAQQNRSYFESLAETGETHASSHFIVGLDGEIVQCIPCNEIAYASNDRNADTIAIECCITDETGRFNESTYNSLVQLVTWLMGRYDLSIDDVIRHYDVTGKDCPKYYVDNPVAWETFKADLLSYIETYGVEKEGN